MSRFRKCAAGLSMAMVFLLHFEAPTGPAPSQGASSLRVGLPAASGLFVRRALRRARSLASRVSRRVRAVGRRIASGAKKVGRRIASGAKKVGRRIASGAKKVGGAIAKGAKKVGGALAKGFSFAKKIFCKTVGAVFCAFIDIVKGAKTFVQRAVKHGLKKAFKMAIDDVKNAIKRKVAELKAEATKVFTAFKSVLTADRYSFARIGNFAKVTFPTLTKLAMQLLTPLMPFPFGPIVATAIGAIGTGVLTPTLAAIAALHFGMKKLLAWIIPKMVLGAGKAFNFVNDKLPPGFKKFIGVLSKVAGIGGPGLLAGALSFVKPEKRERLKALFLKVANVAGRIQQGIEGATKAMQAARGESFAAAEGALKQTPKSESKLSKQDMGKMIDALGEFAKEQILLALDRPLQRLVGFALQGLNRLLDIPRNALVAAVGTIPVAGGALAAALNFGLGVVVDMVNGFVVDGVKRLAGVVVGDAVKEVQKALKKTLLSSEKNMKAAAGFGKLMQTIGKLAAGINQTLKAAAGGQQALFAQMIINALNNFLMRGVRNPEVRQVLSQALSALSAQVTQSTQGGGRFTLTQGVVAILRAVAQPLGQLVSRKIQNPRLANIAGKATEALLTSLANEAGVKRVMSNPAGFLSSVAKDLLLKLKPDLVEAVTGGISNPTVKALATRAIERLIDEIHARGFTAVLGLSKALAAAKSKLKAAGAKVVSTVKAAGAKILGALAARFAQAWSRNCRSALPTLRTIANTVGKFFTRLRPLAQRVLTTLQQRCPSR